MSSVLAVYGFDEKRPINTHIIHNKIASDLHFHMTTPYRIHIEVWKHKIGNRFPSLVRVSFRLPLVAWTYLFASSPRSPHTFQRFSSALAPTTAKRVAKLPHLTRYHEFRLLSAAADAADFQNRLIWIWSMLCGLSDLQAFFVAAVIGGFVEHMQIVGDESCHLSLYKSTFLLVQTSNVNIWHFRNWISLTKPIRR